MSYCFLNSLQDQSVCLYLQSNTELTLDYQAGWPDYVRCTFVHCLFEMGRDYLGRCRSKSCSEKESLDSEVEKT